MCLGTSAHGTSMRETQLSDLKEGTAKSQGTPLRSSPQLGESLSSIHSTHLQRRMSLIVSRGSLSVMGHNAMFSSNGSLLKVIIG
jgi:hypothetical protein